MAETKTIQEWFDMMPPEIKQKRICVAIAVFMRPTDEEGVGVIAGKSLWGCCTHTAPDILQAAAEEIKIETPTCGTHGRTH